MYIEKESAMLRTEILEHLKTQLPARIYQELENANLHLGVFAEPWLSYMLDGRKTIESRFGKNRIAPYCSCGIFYNQRRFVF